MSSTTYRFEQSKTAKALCQNSACKNAQVKIGKGELRMGTLVTFQEHDSWKWKHWGCITPKQIANIQELVEGLDLATDLDIIDGWDELLPESQERIRQAIVNGHVADEDWKGEPELNRPGQKGINKRTPKKKAAVEEEDDHADKEVSPSKKSSTSKKVKNEEPDDEPVPPKKKATKKRKAAEPDVEAEPAPAKKTAKARKAALSEDEATAPKAKKTKAKSAKVAKEEEAIEAPAEPAKRAPRKSKGKTAPMTGYGGPPGDVPKPPSDLKIDLDIDLETKSSKNTKKKMKEAELDEFDKGWPDAVPAKAKKAKKVKKEVEEPKPEPAKKRGGSKKVKASA